MCKIEINGVKITLTEEQLKAIDYQRNNKIDIFSVTTYKDVCKYLKEKELTFKDFAKFSGSIEDNEKLLAFAKIKQLEKFFNQDWIKDWSNKSQYKWYPYFTINVSGCLVFLDCTYYSDSCIGQVGFYQSKEVTKHIGTYFVDIYEKLK